jgi:hypothetical protein
MGWSYGGDVWADVVGLKGRSTDGSEGPTDAREPLRYCWYIAEDAELGRLPSAAKEAAARSSAVTPRMTTGASPETISLVPLRLLMVILIRYPKDTFARSACSVSPRSHPRARDGRQRQPVQFAVSEVSSGASPITVVVPLSSSFNSCWYVLLTPRSSEDSRFCGGIVGLPGEDRSVLSSCSNRLSNATATLTTSDLGSTGCTPTAKGTVSAGPYPFIIGGMDTWTVVEPVPNNPLDTGEGGLEMTLARWSRISRGQLQLCLVVRLPTTTLW